MASEKLKLILIGRKDCGQRDDGVAVDPHTFFWYIEPPFIAKDWITDCTHSPG